jgi:hypothetical protein
MKRLPIAMAVGVALACVAPAASAQSKGDDQPEFMRQPIVAQRRHGFEIGLTAAPASVWVSGTPNAYAQRNAVYEVSLGPTIAPSLSGYLGYALADELSFTLALESSLYRHGDQKISGTSIAFRVEAWPLTAYGKGWRDVGIVGRAGLGSARVTSQSTGDTLASSGTYSLVGLDLVWDAWRVGHLGVGPTIGVSYRKSETYSETDLLLGLRVAIYGGAVSSPQTSPSRPPSPARPQ